jgi:UDP-N-acetylglucosamine--N-acetylmuramyl-(pentapeptide) pyrophosphoryl-undecaprenol N-acetylglucosamine transferase
MMLGLSRLVEAKVQVLWQCGKFYHAEMEQKLKEFGNTEGVLLFEFLKEMDMAYAAADVVVSRAGALSVSEISIAGKPTIFVPSPNVAEDHQTKNAKALVEKEAALLVKDSDAREALIDRAIALINNQAEQEKLGAAIKALAKPNAAEDIVDEIVKLIQ